MTGSPAHVGPADIGLPETFSLQIPVTVEPQRPQEMTPGQRLSSPSRA